MTRLDWSKDRDRRRLHEQGADPLSGDRPKKRPGKAALRAELAAATAKITRRVECRCGHAADVTLPSAWEGKTLRCTVYGRATE